MRRDCSHGFQGPLAISGDLLGICLSFRKPLGKPAPSRTDQTECGQLRLVEDILLGPLPNSVLFHLDLSLTLTVCIYAIYELLAIEICVLMGKVSKFPVPPSASLGRITLHTTHFPQLN